MSDQKIEFIKAIKEAITNGDASSVVSLLNGDVEKTQMTIVAGTWLHYAAVRSPIEISRQLVALGVDVNKRSGTLEGNALNEAAFWGRPDLVRYLHSCGAELDTNSLSGNPLTSAIQGGNHGHTTPGHTEVARYLIDAGIDLSPKYGMSDGIERDALEIARLYGRPEVAKMIEDKLAAG